MMNRAYSLLEVKAIDEDKRIIEGIASTPSVDRVGDIVEPKGAEFKLPLPLLWQHDADQPIGHVIKAEATRNGIRIRAQLVKVNERGPLRARLDDAWQSIKSGLVKGLSIGFKALERERIQDEDGNITGIRFLRWAWLELSAVTIPANEDASILAIKNIDTEQRAASGRKLNGSTTTPGVSGQTTSNSQTKGTWKMKTTEQLIAELEDVRATKAARMEEIAPDEAGDFEDDDAKKEYRALVKEVKELDEKISDQEGILLARKTAKPVKGGDAKTGSDSRKGIVSVKENKLPPGIGLARYAMCLAFAKGNPMLAAHVAKERYPGTDLHDAIMKTTTAGGTTTGTAWAAPLVDYTNLSDFIEYLNPRTIVGQFGTGNIPSLRRVPFNVKVPKVTTQGTAAWTAEGKAKTVVAQGFDTVTLTWAKVAAISVLSDELVRFSTPSAETLVRDLLADSLAVTIDTTFMGTAAADSSKPVGMRVSGTSTSASSGDSADDVREDVKTLFGYFSAVNNMGGLVWIMNETIAISLMLMRNELGQAEFPGITPDGGTFMGYPVIVSNNAPAEVVTLVKPRDILLADDGGVTIDVSREATVNMDTASSGDISIDASPTFVEGLGTGDLTSLWQQNAVGIRAERYISWAKARTGANGAAAYLSSVTWGAPESPG